LKTPTKAEEAKWKSYQVDSRKLGVKLVADLTEAEAKTELCKAMEALENLDGLLCLCTDQVEAWRNDVWPEPRGRTKRR
jgi:hypothetical protein